MSDREDSGQDVRPEGPGRPAPDPRWQALAEHLAEDRAGWSLPGLAAALVVDGRTAWSGGFGRADDAGAPASARTRWRVAAVGQPVLAAAMGHLAEAGVLRLADPLTAWLPEAAALGLPQEVSLADCAAHASGLPPMPPLEPDALAALRFPTREALLASLAPVGARPFERAGAGFSYSSWAWALVCEALSRAAGRRIEDYATEHVLAPLGMHESGWHEPTEDARREDAAQDEAQDEAETHRATGYGAFGDPPTPAPAPRLGAFTAPWGLWSTAADMARFLAWQLSSDQERQHADAMRDLRPPLSLAMLRALQTPHVIEADKHSGATPGWLVGLTAAGPTLFHGGADPGFAAYAALSPRLGLAAFVAANRASNPEALGEMAHGMIGFAREVLGR